MFLFWSYTLKNNKKISFPHKTTSQSAVSKCTWCQPSAAWRCTKHISMLPGPVAVFLPILPIRFCFLALFFCYLRLYGFWKDPRVCATDKWQPREVVWCRTRITSVLVSFSITTGALSSFISNPKQLKTRSEYAPHAAETGSSSCSVCLKSI